MLSDRAAAFIAWFTWVVVVALPVLAGIAIRRFFPSWHPAVAWLVGCLVLVGCFVLVEGIWRVLKWLATMGKSEPAPLPTTTERRAAELLSVALTDRRVTPERILHSWPEDVSNPLVFQARTLLMECSDPTARTFDQRKLNARLQDLNHLLNQLRV